MLKLCKINPCSNGTLGIHLSRAPYDPYPWVSGVLENSSAYQSGIRIGDTILECNGNDVLGWKISELAIKIRNHWDCGGKIVNFLIWRNKPDGNVSSAINQQSLQKFATCLQNIAQLLECPICLEVIKPPGWQCCNGHVLCNSCRNRSVKCPICRVPFGPRGRCLLSDKLFTLLAETFPCDGGTKNGSNKNGRCPQENSKTKKNNLTTKSVSSVLESSSLSSQTFGQTQNLLPSNNNNEENTSTTTTTTTTTRTTTTPIATTATTPGTTTRVITVGEDTRTSPVKNRNNRITSHLKISNLLNSHEEPLTTTTTITSTKTSIPEIIEPTMVDLTEQPSNLSRRIISLPTAATTTTSTTNTTTTDSSELITETIATTPIQMQSSLSSINSTVMANSNPNGLNKEKLKKQIISLKVKSKSSENLKLSYRNISKGEENELLCCKQASLSLPASPVSNLVNSKKFLKTTKSKMNLGCESIQSNASQRNDKILTTNKITTLSKKTESQKKCSSNFLWSNFIRPNKNYHCPTGKSSCVIEEIDEIFSSSTTSSSSASSSSSSEFCHQKYHTNTSSSLSNSILTTNLNKMKIDENYCDCCKQKNENEFYNIVEPEFIEGEQNQLNSLESMRMKMEIEKPSKNKPNRNNNIETNFKMDSGLIRQTLKSFNHPQHTNSCKHTNYKYTDLKKNKQQQKDIKFQIHSRTLNHLRRKHKISLCQYHCGFDEQIPIDLKIMNIKSNILMCISIDSEYNENENNIDDDDDGDSSSTADIADYNKNKNIEKFMKSIHKNNRKISPSNSISSTSSSSSSSSSMSSQITFASTADDDNKSNISYKCYCNKNDCTSCCCDDVDKNDDDFTTKENLIIKSPIVKTYKLKNFENIPKEKILTTPDPKVKISSTINTLEGVNRALSQIQQRNITKSCNNLETTFTIDNKSFDNLKLSSKDTSSIISYPNKYRQVYHEKSFQYYNSSIGLNRLNNEIETEYKKCSINKNTQILQNNMLNSKTFQTTPKKLQINLDKNHIPKAFEYKISIESIEKINMETELFFVIKIPLNNSDVNVCCCNKYNNNNNNNKCMNNRENIIKNNVHHVDNSNEQNISKMNLTQKYNQNLFNNYNSIITTMPQYNFETQTQQQQNTDVQNDTKINQSKNFINHDEKTSNVHVFEQSISLPLIDSTTYNFQHQNQQNYNNIYDQHQKYQNICSQNRQKHLEYNNQHSDADIKFKQNSVEFSDHIVNNNKKYCHCSNCCPSCIIPKSLDTNITCKPQAEICKIKKISPNNNNNNNNDILKVTSTLKNSFTKNKPKNLHDIANCCNSCLYCSNNDIYNKNNICNFDKNKSAIFIWYCGNSNDDELNVKNFRAVIECCNSIVASKKRDNNTNKIIIHNATTTTSTTDDDDNDNVKKQKLFYDFNNKLRSTNNMVNSTSKCNIHEFNIKNSNISAISKTITINSSVLNDSNDNDIDNNNNNNNDNQKILLWIHPMTKSWNCIQNQMQFHVFEDNHDDDDDGNDV